MKWVILVTLTISNSFTIFNKSFEHDIMYLPNQWPCETSHNDPKLFDTIEEAEAERKNWNTGMIVDYFDDAIRPMNPEERKASLLRGLKNNGRK